MKVGYTSHVADGGQSYLRRLFLERASKVPNLISSLEKGRKLPSLSVVTRVLASRTVLADAKVEQWQFLIEWSRSWRMDADWVRKSAHELLLTWPEEEPYLTCVGPLPGFVPPEMPAYFPTVLTRKQYLKLARTALEPFY